NTESEEFEEDTERKEGSGQFESSRNPKGAGRPSNIWRDFKDFGEWKAAVKAGLIPRDLSELLGRVADSGERRGEGDSKPDVKGLLAQLGEMIGVKKKDIDKLGLADDQIKQASKFVMPYLLPKLLGVIGLVAGAIILYKIEELKVTDTFTEEEWDKLPDYKKSKYLRIWRPITDERGERTTL
ncbi:unnamed protein product, partial [marine sediment metagenome]